MTSREEWRPVAEAGGVYEVSSLGRIRSRKRAGEPRIMSPQLTTKGYPSVGPRIGGRSRRVHVHTLALRAFVGPRPAGHGASHLDGSRTNNRLDNLRWETPAENNARKIGHGTIPRGEGHARSKLDDATVREIMRLAATGMDHKDVGRAVGVSRSRVSKIACGREWTHVTGLSAESAPRRKTRLRGERHGHSRMTEDGVRRARRLAASGTPRSELAREYGVHPCTMDKIIRGERWGHIPLEEAS